MQIRGDRHQTKGTIFEEKILTYFLLKHGSFCLMAMKFCKIVKTVIIELLLEKNSQILPRSTTEHAPKNLIFNLNFSV